MGHISFYETAAQVIPLLLLAAVVDTNFLKKLRPLLGRDPSRLQLLLDASVLPIGVVVIFAGELAALHVSFTGEPSEWEHRLTALAILAGAFGLFTPVLNTVIEATMVGLKPHGAGWEAYAEWTGRIAIAVIHLALLSLAVLIVAGSIR